MNEPTKPDKAAALAYILRAKSLSLSSDKWMIVGYLAEVEWKTAGLSREVMGKVREARQGFEKKNVVPDFQSLMGLVERL